MLNLAMLGSGSGGNACLVWDQETRILIDAGFSGAELRKRMEPLGAHPDELEACLITHEHGDHIKGASILARRHGVKLFMHAATHSALKRKFQGTEQVRHFELKEVMELGSLVVTSVPTLHDSASATGFLVRSGATQVGYLTDLGAVTEENFLMLKDVDYLVMEANHDRDMLWNGPYPPHLKARVDGRFGHLSNEHSAEFIDLLVKLGRLKGVMLAHLSEKNNRPEHALQAVRQKVGPRFPITVAAQDQPSKTISVETT